MYHLKQKTTGELLCSYNSYEEAEQTRVNYKLNSCFIDYTENKRSLTSLSFEDCISFTANIIVYSIPVLVALLLLNF